MKARHPRTRLLLGSTAVCAGLAVTGLGLAASASAAPFGAPGICLPLLPCQGPPPPAPGPGLGLGPGPGMGMGPAIGPAGGGPGMPFRLWRP